MEQTFVSRAVVMRDRCDKALKLVSRDRNDKAQVEEFRLHPSRRLGSRFIREYLLLVVAIKTTRLTCRPIEAYNFMLYGCAVKEEGP